MQSRDPYAPTILSDPPKVIAVQGSSVYEVPMRWRQDASGRLIGRFESTDFPLETPTTESNGDINTDTAEEEFMPDEEFYITGIEGYNDAFSFSEDIQAEDDIIGYLASYSPFVDEHLPLPAELEIRPLTNVAKTPHHRPFISSLTTSQSSTADATTIPRLRLLSSLSIHSSSPSSSSLAQESSLTDQEETSTFSSSASTQVYTPHMTSSISPMGSSESKTLSHSTSDTSFIEVMEQSSSFPVSASADNVFTSLASTTASLEQGTVSDSSTASATSLDNPQGTSSSSLTGSFSETYSPAKLTSSVSERESITISSAESVLPSTSETASATLAEVLLSSQSLGSKLSDMTHTEDFGDVLFTSFDASSQEADEAFSSSIDTSEDEEEVSSTLTSTSMEYSISPTRLASSHLSSTTSLASEFSMTATADHDIVTSGPVTSSPSTSSMGQTSVEKSEYNTASTVSTANAMSAAIDTSSFASSDTSDSASQMTQWTSSRALLSSTSVLPSSESASVASDLITTDALERDSSGSVSRPDDTNWQSSSSDWSESKSNISTDVTQAFTNLSTDYIPSTYSSEEGGHSLTTATYSSQATSSDDEHTSAPEETSIMSSAIDPTSTSSDSVTSSSSEAVESSSSQSLTSTTFDSESISGRLTSTDDATMTSSLTGPTLMSSAIQSTSIERDSSETRRITSTEKTLSSTETATSGDGSWRESTRSSTSELLDSTMTRERTESFEASTGSTESSIDDSSTTSAQSPVSATTQSTTSEDYNASTEESMASLTSETAYAIEWTPTEQAETLTSASQPFSHEDWDTSTEFLGTSQSSVYTSRRDRTEDVSSQPGTRMSSESNTLSISSGSTRSAEASGGSTESSTIGFLRSLLSTSSADSTSTITEMQTEPVEEVKAQRPLAYIPMRDQKDLMPLEALVLDPDLQSLGSAVQQNEKYEILRKVGMTIFAPVDAAFMNLPIDIDSVQDTNTLKRPARAKEAGAQLGAAIRRMRRDSASPTNTNHRPASSSPRRLSDAEISLPEERVPLRNLTACDPYEDGPCQNGHLQHGANLIGSKFAQMSKDIKRAKNKEVLEDFEKLIMFHVVKRIIPPGMIEAKQKLSLRTEFKGRNLEVGVYTDISGKKEVLVAEGQAKVIEIVACRNGFIYKIDRPLFPAWNVGAPTLVDGIRSNPRFTKLRYLLDKTGMFDAWAQAGPVTMLLIPDEAWKIDGLMIPPCFFKALVRPENADLLAKLLKWTTIPGLWTKEDIQATSWLPNGIAPSLSVTTIDMSSWSQSQRARMELWTDREKLYTSGLHWAHNIEELPEAIPVVESEKVMTLIEGKEVVDWDIPFYNGYGHTIAELPLRPDIDLRAILWDCMDMFCGECPIITKFLLKYLDGGGLLPDVTNPKAYIVPPGPRPDWVCAGAHKWFPPGWDEHEWYKYLDYAKSGNSKLARQLAYQGWRMAAVRVAELDDKLREAEIHLRQIWHHYGNPSSYLVGEKQDPNLLLGWLKNKRSLEIKPRICDGTAPKKPGALLDVEDPWEGDADAMWGGPPVAYPMSLREDFYNAVGREKIRKVTMEDLKYLTQWL